MLNTGKLAGRTLFITGGSRGIGKEIALKCAKDGANVVIAAKTATPHAKLEGTIYTAAEEVVKSGGSCLPVVMDIRDEQQVINAVNAAVDKFGGIDILVNNASAISLTGTVETTMKRFDLMFQCNVRGTFMTSKYCVPHLSKSGFGKILNISPPLDMRPLWFQNHVAYTMSKYGMSLCVLGMAEEFKDRNISVNALWPKTAIMTAAMEYLMGGDKTEAARGSRLPTILADAAYALLLRPQSFTGNFCIDEQVLREEGINDFKQYDCVPGSRLKPDFFLPENVMKEFGDGEISGLSKSFDTKKPNAGDKVGMKVLFDEISPMLSSEAFSSVGGTFVFKVQSGDEYWIDFKTNPPSSGTGTPSSDVDVTFIADQTTFFDMFSSKIKPTAAFMSGKLKIKGDIGKAMKLERLLPQMKAKL